MPDRLDGRGVAALDDEGRVNLAALDGVAHNHSLLGSRAGTGQESAEAVQLAFGGQPLPADPVRGRLEGTRDELAGADPARLPRGDRPGRLQDAQVLHD